MNAKSPPRLWRKGLLCFRVRNCLSDFQRMRIACWHLSGNPTNRELTTWMKLDCRTGKDKSARCDNRRRGTMDDQDHSGTAAHRLVGMYSRIRATELRW